MYFMSSDMIQWTSWKAIPGLSKCWVDDDQRTLVGGMGKGEKANRYLRKVE